ncbi:MAG: hypothetical protein R2771_04525 [Saprospiraceae bacterium]
MTDINKLIEKYWNGDTSLEEESELRNFLKKDNSQEFEDLKTMFLFFENEKQISFDKEFKPAQSKVIKHNFRKNIAIAASIIILIFSGILIFNTNSNHQTKNITNPDEAMKVSQEALNLLALNFNKGEKNIKENIINLDKLDIFK